MKTKLEMAHEWYMMQTRRNGCALVADAWKYADAMQAAADEREKQNKDELKPVPLEASDHMKCSVRDLAPDIEDFELMSKADWENLCADIYKKMVEESD